MRKSSNIVIIPVNQPFTGSVPDIVDKAMDHASRSLPEMDGLVKPIATNGGNVDVRGRRAKNHTQYLCSLWNW